MDLQSWRKRFTKGAWRGDEEKVGRAVREKSTSRDEMRLGHVAFARPENPESTGSLGVMGGGAAKVAIRPRSPKHPSYNDELVANYRKSWSSDRASMTSSTNAVTWADDAETKGTSGEQGGGGGAESPSQKWQNNRPSLKLELTNRREQLKEAARTSNKKPQILVTSPQASPKTTESLVKEKKRFMHRSRERGSLEAPEVVASAGSAGVPCVQRKGGQQEAKKETRVGRRRSFVNRFLHRNKSSDPSNCKPMATECGNARHPHGKHPSLNLPPSTLQPVNSSELLTDAGKASTPQVARKKYSGFGRLISKWKSSSDIPNSVDTAENEGRDVDSGEDVTDTWGVSYEENHSDARTNSVCEASLTPLMYNYGSPTQTDVAFRNSIRLPKMLSRRKTIADGTTESIDIGGGSRKRDGAAAELAGLAENTIDFRRISLSGPHGGVKFGCSSEDDDDDAEDDSVDAHYSDDREVFEIAPVKYSVAEKIKNRLSSSKLQDLDKVYYAVNR